MKDKIIKYDKFKVGIYISIISLVIVFFSWGIYVVDKDLSDSITTAAAFVGIFATFVGAYLGAKVAGEYTLEATKETINFQIDGEKSLLIYRVNKYLEDFKGIVGHMSVLHAFLKNWNELDNLKIESGNIKKLIDELDNLKKLHINFENIIETSSFIHLDNDIQNNIKKINNHTKTLITQLNIYLKNRSTVIEGEDFEKRMLTEINFQFNEVYKNAHEIMMFFDNSNEEK